MAHSEEFVRAVTSFVDTVLDHGRDTYGSDQTPLFVDTLTTDTKEPAHYDTAHRIRRDNPDATLSNPATQQEFFRALVGLTQVTGEEQYRAAAHETMEYIFDTLTDERGLIEWGGHVAHDLERDEPVSWHMVHELKWTYPFYELMWEVDPEATERFIEAMWNAHVHDWAILDFNRHGGYDEEMGPLWEHEYEGGEVFFMGDGLTFVNTGSDLYYAAGMLSKFSGDDDPLRWAKRLAHRYVETRQETGISGYQFSTMASGGVGAESNLLGDRAEYQMGPFIHGDRRVLDGTIFKPQPRVQRRQLLLGELLGDRGDEFRQWSLEELRAWGEVTYRPEENTFEKILTDGFPLEGFVQRIDGYYGEKGSVIQPIEATLEFFWTYAHAYRVSDDEFFWQMARDIARGNGLGDIGTPDGTALSVETGTDIERRQAVYGLLELYRATERDDYLDLAAEIGDNILANRFTDGLFETVDEVCHVGDPTPLALLHLAAALQGRDLGELPPPGGMTHWYELRPPETEG